MEAFRYQALDAAGRSVSGVLQAETPRDARTRLRERGQLPSAVEKNARQPWARGVSAAQLSLLTRQMATLLDSGLTMEQALAALIEEAEAPSTRELLAGVKTEVMAGASLAAALGTYPRSFPEFYRALVQGGEDSPTSPTIWMRARRCGRRPASPFSTRSWSASWRSPSSPACWCTWCRRSCMSSSSRGRPCRCSRAR
jgi:general secretion pathway protein F